MTLRPPAKACASILLAALLVPLLPAQTTAKTLTVHLDPAQTEIHWTLGDVLHTVHGTFALKSGVITFDPASGHADGAIIVDLDSGNSGNATRDRLMKQNILQTERYPQATFHPQKFAGLLHSGAGQTITVDGTLTVHGEDHPSELVITVTALGANHATATTRFVVPYVAWGMRDPSTFVLRVEKQVTVDVTAQGTVEGLQ